MIGKLKRPSTMMILPESDREKEATRKRQRRTYADSTTLQAAFILALSAELHRAGDLTGKPSQSPPSFCDKSSSLQGFATSGQEQHNDETRTMICSKNSQSIATLQQMLDESRTNVKHHKVEVANPIIKTSATAYTRRSNPSSLPSGKPLLAPPRLPHLKLGERLSRQKC